MVLSLCTIMCLISALSYLVMALGYGYMQTRGGRYKTLHVYAALTAQTHDREKYYVRYLDWLLTTPLILAELYILRLCAQHDP